jgi:ribonuclease HII
VILDAERIPEGLDDSKKLTAKVREKLFDQIMGCAQVGVGQSSVAEIDASNILAATLQAMARSVDNLGTEIDLALVDGNHPPPLGCPVETVVKGDGKSLSIAAASIIAKVTRDRIMTNLALEYPDFGWQRNSGYGTAQHAEALENQGITPHHRRSFAPVRKRIAKDSAATS